MNKTNLPDETLILIRRKIKAGINLKKIALETKLRYDVIKDIFNEYINEPYDYVVPDKRERLNQMKEIEQQLFKAIEENKPYKVLLTAYTKPCY